MMDIDALERHVQAQSASAPLTPGALDRIRRLP
jgi:hypothetical protein